MCAELLCLYVCMYEICTYVLQRTYVCMYVQYVCMCEKDNTFYMYVYACTHEGLHMKGRTVVCLPCMCVCLVCMYVCMYVCMPAYHPKGRVSKSCFQGCKKNPCATFINNTHAYVRTYVLQRAYVSGYAQYVYIRTYIHKHVRTVAYIHNYVPTYVRTYCTVYTQVFIYLWCV